MRAISEELKLIYLNTFDSQLSVDFVLARWQYKTIGSYPSSSSILMSREKGKFGDFVNWEQLHQSTWGIGSNSTYHQPKDKCLQRAAPAGWSNSTAMLQDRAFSFRGSNSTSGHAVQANLTSERVSKENWFYFIKIFQIMSRSQKEKRSWAFHFSLVLWIRFCICSECTFLHKWLDSWGVCPKEMKS